MAEVNYYYTSTTGGNDNKKKKKPGLFLLCFLMILVGLYLYFIKIHEKQYRLNLETEKLIAQSEREFSNITTQLDSLSTLKFEKGQIYLANEKKLDTLILERRRLVNKLKAQLKEQKVLRGDYNKLNSYNNKIKIELTEIITKNDEKRVSLKELDSLITAFNDSVKKSSEGTSGKVVNKNHEFCSPVIELSIEPYANCDKDSVSYKPNPDLRCFKLTISANKIYRGYNSFSIKIQDHKGLLMEYKLYDSGGKMISGKTFFSKITIPKEGPYEYRVELVKKAKKFPIKFIISQTLDGCDQPFNSLKDYPGLN